MFDVKVAQGSFETQTQTGVGAADSGRHVLGDSCAIIFRGLIRISICERFVRRIACIKHWLELIKT